MVMYVMDAMKRSFNPYFNGSSTSTDAFLDNFENESTGFNPYFNGSSTSTHTHSSNFLILNLFQSLF